MSRASRQSLALISVVHGGIRAVQQCFTLGDEFAVMVKLADTRVQDVVIHWPTSGDEAANQAWIAEQLHEWGVVLESMPQKWTIMANVSISLTILADLYDKVTCRGKKVALQGLFVYLSAIQDFLNDAGNSFGDYEYASDCVSRLYNIIGFEP
jgi:hypothetical protein